MHIIKDIKRPSQELVSEFVKLPSATVIEAAGKKGAMAYQIKPLDREMKLCGSALTVASHVGDNITLHKAITVAQPGMCSLRMWAITERLVGGERLLPLLPG